MFAQITPVPMLAVRDIAKARRFYTDTMGLQEERQGMEGVLQFRAGDMVFVVYPSEYAGTNKATALTWVVGDQLEKVVEALRGKGVAFEHYELPGTVRKGEIHESGPIRNAWFKDPDGNIHAVSNLG
jgi:catechol 2,3-dioxygenase-like lactoylglutathione lyase family enzyme